MTREQKRHRCRAGKDPRCDYYGTRDELQEHAGGVGHPQCVLCRDPLAWHEQQTCGSCINHVRDNLVGVARGYAHLERVIRHGAYRTGRVLTGHALVYVTDGSTEGGGPDDWLTDPTPVVAILEANERAWRRVFQHGPAEEIATVARCLAYLQKWHLRAAREFSGFDDYAAEIRDLRARLEHTVGLADDPEPAAPCFACHGDLVREYGDAGLSDDRVCRGCGAVYEPKDYWFALRVHTQQDGWVPAEEAADRVDRPIATVRAWVQAGFVPVACNRFTRRTVIELAAVQERSDATPRVVRRSA